jgi:hypothetical protein
MDMPDGLDRPRFYILCISISRKPPLVYVCGDHEDGECIYSTGLGSRGFDGLFFPPLVWRRVCLFLAFWDDSFILSSVGLLYALAFFFFFF